MKSDPRMVGAYARIYTDPAQAKLLLNPVIGAKGYGPSVLRLENWQRSMCFNQPTDLPSVPPAGIPTNALEPATMVEGLSTAQQQRMEKWL